MNTSARLQASTTICKKHKVPMVKIVDNNLQKLNISFLLNEYCEECEKEEDVKRAEQKTKNDESENFEKENRGIPKRFIGARLSDFDNISTVLDWVYNPKGFLFISGPCGTGKSHLACAIKHFFNCKGTPSGMAFCSNVFLELRSSFNSKETNEFDIIKKYAPDEAKIGIFDDIGAQKISEYVIEAWYNIIDKRYMWEHPTVFTSNLSLSEISACMTDRIASRLVSGKQFELNGDDRRLKRK